MTSELPMSVIPRVVLSMLAVSGAAHARDIEQLGPLRANAGEAVSGYLDVPARGDEGARIPVSLVRGTGTGPVLALVAGTHGYEYPGISALQRLRQSIDPHTLRGTLILVHIANPPSFYGRTIYTSPADGKNLNRVFPGRPDGSLSERIAHEITTQVIAQADFLVDLHAGDGNEALRPYVYMPVTGDAPLDAATRGMALAFGLDHIVIDSGRIQPREATQFVDQTALARGVPAITTETGQLGQNDEHSIALAERGVRNLMRHLGMLDGKPEPNPGPRDCPRRLRDCRRRLARRTLRSLRRQGCGRARADRGHRQLRRWHAARGRGSAIGDGQPHFDAAVTLNRRVMSWCAKKETPGKPGVSLLVALRNSTVWT
jgi:predicted deacylase